MNIHAEDHTTLIVDQITDLTAEMNRAWNDRSSISGVSPAKATLSSLKSSSASSFNCRVTASSLSSVKDNPV